MKKIGHIRFLLLLILLAGFSSYGFSQILYVENFNYSDGTTLESVGFSVTSAIEPILVKTPGLTYPDYAGSAIGNASYLSANDQDVYMNYISTSYTTGTTYLAAMVKITNATATGDYFLSLGPSDQNVKRGRVFAKDDGSGNIVFGISKGSTTTVNYTSTKYSKDTTYLIVLKYQIVDLATNDGVDLFVFNSSTDAFPASEPGSSTVSYTDLTTSDAANLKKFHLRQSSNAQSIIDGIRIAYTWEGVVSPSSVATLSSLNLDGTLITGFDPQVTDYVVDLNPGTIVVPVVTASTTEVTATTIITQAPDVNGVASVQVTAENGVTTQTYTVDFNTRLLSSAKNIVSFTIPGQISSSINVDSLTVNVVMPKNTDLTALTPEIVISDSATIVPASGVAQDFTNPVTYSVTAEDGTSQDWIVTVTIYTEMTPVYEPFDYTPQELLTAQNGWSALNTAGNTEPVIAEGNLIYNMIYPPTGNKVTFDADGTDISMQFESQSTIGTLLYFSFIFQVTDMSAITSTDGTHFSGFVISPSTYGAGVYLKWDGVAESNKFYIGTATRATTSSLQNGLIDWTESTYDINTPIFVVGAYEMIDGEFNDKSYLWVNPDPSTFGVTNAPVALLSSTTAGGTSSDMAAIGRFYIRQDGSTSTPFMEFDELRIAGSWANVTPKAPELSFVPSHGTTDVSEFVNPMIYYVIPVRNIDDSPIENSDITSLVTLKEGNESGADVAFSGTISENKMIFTIVPDMPLSLATDYYIYIVDLENESGESVKGASATFTTRNPETVATLEALSYNGISVPDFSSEVISYDIVLDYGTIDIPVLDWMLTDTNASAVVSNLTSFPGTSTVTVTAEDGVTTTTYSINFSVSNIQSNDATLKEIRINGELLPGFDPGIYEYQYALPFGTTQAPVITAVANSQVATVSYFQPPSTTSLGGVVVTAQDGTEAQYAIFFSLDPYIYALGWENTELPSGWTTSNTIISTNFGSEPITSHNEFEGAYAFRFICPKAASGSSSGWLGTALYPKSGILRFWAYVQLPDGNESLTITKKVKGGDSTVVAILNASDLQSTNWKEFSYEINESDSTQIFFISSLTQDGDTRIWIDDLSLRGMTSTGIHPELDNSALTIYPNPATDIINIWMESNVFDHIEIVNLNGQKMVDVTPDSDLISIPLSGFKSGIYMVKATGKSKVSISRFIKL